jgi:hypothetical protein
VSDRADSAPRRALRRAIVRSLLRAVISIVAVIAAYYVLPIEPETDVGAVVRIVLGSILVAVIAVVEIRAVAGSAHPRIRAVDALAVSVSVMVTAFASMYLNLSSRDAGAFNEPLGRTSALYFTMTTLTTVGFGDIVALTDGARIAVMVQFVFNVAVIGTTVRLILGTAKQHHEASGRSPT